MRRVLLFAWLLLRAAAAAAAAPTPRERTALKALHALVLTEHDGDVLDAFAQADADKDGLVGASELQSVLHRAGLGDYWLRLAWSRRVLDKLDGPDGPEGLDGSVGDGKLSLAELRRALPDHLLPVEYKDVEHCFDETCIARNGPMQT